MFYYLKTEMVDESIPTTYRGKCQSRANGGKPLLPYPNVLSLKSEKPKNQYNLRLNRSRLSSFSSIIIVSPTIFYRFLSVEKFEFVYFPIPNLPPYTSLFLHHHHHFRQIPLPFSFCPLYFLSENDDSCVEEQLFATWAGLQS